MKKSLKKIAVIPSLVLKKNFSEFLGLTDECLLVIIPKKIFHNNKLDFKETEFELKLQKQQLVLFSKETQQKVNTLPGEQYAKE